MASATEYSRVTDWNTLRLRGSPQEHRRVFSPQYTAFTAVLRAHDIGGWTEPAHVELTDEELVREAEQEGHFDSLDDPAEDIYTWDDGEEI